MIAYKFLEAGRIGPYYGYQWPEPGVWLPPIEGDLVMCQRGYHLCRPADLIHWIDAELWRVEYRGEVMEGDNKIAVRECRIVEQAEPWNERTARLFAADCAEDVLPLFEREYPGDNRPRAAIETARAFANGECAEADLVAAADAAWAAARDAEAAAVRDAAAAGDAAAAAAADAAWHAVRDAAADAAAAAAGDAAWAAAWDAAAAAAWDAAAAAAWDAAWDAARQKQNIRLLALLEIES